MGHFMSGKTDSMTFFSDHSVQNFSLPESQYIYIPLTVFFP